MEGHALIECICLALYSVSYRNNVYKKLIQGSACSITNNNSSSSVYSIDPGASLPVITGGLAALLQFCKLKCSQVDKLLNCSTNSELLSDNRSEIDSNRLAELNSALVNSGMALCGTIAWIWRLIGY